MRWFSLNKQTNIDIKKFIDTFENLSEEIIKATRNDNAIKVDACILTFSHVILKYVLENYECKKQVYWKPPEICSVFK